MEDWVNRALARWPNVPALFGWLGLDRRGHWTIQGERISRPQIIETINANYAADERGQWFFQNGPQRGYVDLEAAPLILHAQPDGTLLAHTGHAIPTPTAAWIDETGAMFLDTARGPGLLADADLPWALERLSGAQGAVDEAELAQALTLPHGSASALRLTIGDTALPLYRLDHARAAQVLGFVAHPRGET